MKIDRLKRRSGGDLILEITPLIDVVFLLLIFFMLATTFDDTAAFKIDLPKSTVAKTKSTLKEVQILIDKDRNMMMEQKIIKNKLLWKNFQILLVTN